MRTPVGRIRSELRGSMPCVKCQPGDLVFDPQLLEFEPGDFRLVGSPSRSLFGQTLLQGAMLVRELVQVCWNGHQVLRLVWNDGSEFARLTAAVNQIDVGQIDVG